MSSEHSAGLIGPGAVALVVGPSGAGKDALISGAKARLAGDPTFSFPRRVITRPPHDAEAHIPMAAATFAAAERDGAFALSWDAHGVRYGIPAAVDDDVRSGRVVVVNVSRTILASARERYLRTCVILVDCPAPILAERLAARGRERADEILGRLQRTVDGFTHKIADVTIMNDGTLQIGTERLVSALRDLATTPLKTA